MDVWAYFRFTTLSLLLGFAFFCLSYATWVWRKRQASQQSTGSSLRQLLSGWSRGLLLAGIALACVAWIINEVVPVRGVMRLHESYAARARPDTGVSYLAPRGPIKQGEILARFEPGYFQAELAVLQAKHDKLCAEREKTDALPLEIDEELTREHQNILSRIEQAQGALNTLIPLLKETVRIGLEKKLERLDKYVEVDRHISEHEATHKQTLADYDYRYKDFQRATKLAANDGIITTNELDLKRLEAIRFAEQITKIEKSIEQFRREAQQLKSNTIAFEKLINEQADSLSAEVEKFRHRLAAAEEDLERITASIARDRARATRQRDAERRMVTAEMQEIEASMRSLREGHVVLAPYSGEVVYRSAAPNAVEEQGVMLVMAQSKLAEVQFSLPKSQVPALWKADKLDVWIEDAVLAPRLSGQLRDVEPSPVHDQHMLASVTCKPPMDVLLMLANEQLVPIQLTWSPPLLTLPVFQLALALILLGGTGTLLTLQWNSISASQPVEEHQESHMKSGSPSTSETPDLRTWKQIGLHQGSSGAMLHILGNKFREALIHGTLDADLIASLEWGLDRHQGRAVKLIRLGFTGSLTQEESVEDLLHRALDQLEKNQQWDKALHERLLAILNTLGIMNDSGVIGRVASDSLHD